MTTIYARATDQVLSASRRPSGLRKTRETNNSLAHRTTWLRSDLGAFLMQKRREKHDNDIRKSD